MGNKFDEFVIERRYLRNVTPATVEWYRQSLKWLGVESPTEADLKAFVIRMREKGLKATGCNNRIRAVNAHLHWASNPDTKCGPACRHSRIPRIKEPQLVLPTFSSQQVSQLIRYRPRTSTQRRLHLLVLLLLDTGCRISEALALCAGDCDLDNLLLTLNGKGQKQRRVPFSLELRRVLFRHVRDLQPRAFVFATRDGNRLDKNIVRRNVKFLCERLGFEPPPRTLHAMRHTMASNWIRKGGSVVTPQRILGHSTITVTMKYVHLQVEDLQAVHPTVSLLR